MPNIIKTITATKRTPPITVKSHFVWNANIVNAKHIPAVMPMANQICYGSSISYNRIIRPKVEFTSCTLYLAVMVPNRKLCASVNNPKNMKFIGALRRTFVQHAIDIIVTSITPNATQNISTKFEEKN